MMKMSKYPIGLLPAQQLSMQIVKKSYPNIETGSLNQFRADIFSAACAKNDMVLVKQEPFLKKN